MRKLAALTFVTLDGVMQGVSSPEEDASGGFTLGGWAMPYWDEVMEQVGEEAMASPYDLLLGRKTYELFASAPKSLQMNDARKYVVTSSLDELDWQNSTIINGDVATEVACLKAEDGPLLQVHGSHQLIQELLANDLIDEYRLWVFPVVLGSGKRLFGVGSVPTGSLQLVKTRTTRNGAVMCIYKRSLATEGT